MISRGVQGETVMGEEALFADEVPTATDAGAAMVSLSWMNWQTLMRRR